MPTRPAGMSVEPYKQEEACEEELTRWERCAKQRMRAWQPLLTPRWIIPLYIACGAIFLALGAGLVVTSGRVEEYVRDYTDMPGDDNGIGMLDIHVERDMNPPLWVYYQLDGFHQNHRRYVKSRSDSQLRDAEGSPKIHAHELDDCKPWVLTGDRVNYPCGLVARSVFNDTYELFVKGSDANDRWRRLDVDSKAATIAWSADLGGRFSNLDPERKTHSDLQNQVLINMWILQQFPPVACEQVNISADVPYLPVQIGTRNITFPADPAANRQETQVEVNDCRGYMSGSPSCRFVRDGSNFTCTGDYREVRIDNWGIESGHFVNWMRVAGLPTFRKLWGRMSTTIEAGSTIRVYYHSKFPVKPHHGRKAFVISTSSAVGGRNDFLGYAYLVVGGCCLLFGVAFMWQNFTRPRSLGDISLLCRFEEGADW